jgi:hypothetical protein
MDDYEKLQKMDRNSLDELKKRAEVIIGRMAERTGGTPIDFHTILEANRTDLENRHTWITRSD